MKIGVFTYEKPHKWTTDLVTRAHLEGHKIVVLVGAPWKELAVPKPAVRLKPKSVGGIEPRMLASLVGAQYIVQDHGKVGGDWDVDLWVIGGARILPKRTIEACGKVLNIHPGILPLYKGLNALERAVTDGGPIGCTAHYIDEKVDEGETVAMAQLVPDNDDTLVDLYLRQQEQRLRLLIDTLRDYDTTLQAKN